MPKVFKIRLVLLFSLMLGIIRVAWAEDFVFMTKTTQLMLEPNGRARSLVDKLDGSEQLNPTGQPFANVTLHGKQFPVTVIERRGELYHLTFGSSGVSADYRITATADSIVAEVVATQGEPIEEMQIVRLNTALSTSGGVLLAVRWDSKFAICLMGLEQEVHTGVSGPVLWSAVYPQFGIQGRRVAIIATPTQQFLSTVQHVESDFRLFSPPPTIDGTWAKLSPDARSNYLFTDMTEANVDDTIRYAKLGGFRYILIYSGTWSTTFGSYRINTVNFPHGEAGLRSVIDKCHAAGLKVGMHMLSGFIRKNDPLVLEKPDIGLLKDDKGVPLQPNGAYVADLRSPLAAAITNRIADVINRAGFDMVYFDNDFSGQFPGWYWMGVQQAQIWALTKGNLLAQGSAITDWTWHIFTRGTCDDFASVAVKQYLDYHKIPDYWVKNHNAFMPSDLGWVGLLQDSPEHPATTPDEVEYYATRMLALDSAISYETTLTALKGNGRTEEMLKLLDEYEQLKQSGAVPAAVRQRLTQGEWHMTRPGEFHPIRYDAERVALPAAVDIKNEFQQQPLKFRLQVMPSLAAPGDSANLSLLTAKEPMEVEPPRDDAAMPGALVERIELNKPTQNGESAWLIGPAAHAPARTIDLATHRSLAVKLTVEGAQQTAGESPVINFQLESSGSTYRDYYVDLNFSGTRTIVIPEPSTSRTLAEFRPAFSNYNFKSAMYSFNYSNIMALNLRWMRYPKDSGIRCQVESVEALAERSSALKDLEISVGQARFSIPGTMKTGDYAEYWGDGPIRIYDKNGFLLRTADEGNPPPLMPGTNAVAITGSRPGIVKLTTITIGQ